MRPRTSTEQTFDNKFHLGKFEKPNDQRYGIIIKTTPFQKAFILEDISAIRLSDDDKDKDKDKEEEFPSTFVTTGRTKTTIKYIDNKWRLAALLFVKYDLDVLAFFRKQMLEGMPELFRAYDQTRNYFVIPLRIYKDDKWPVGTVTVYQLKYFGIPTIATTWDIWKNIAWNFGKSVNSFKYQEYDFESKQVREIFATQFTYLLK